MAENLRERIASRWRRVFARKPPTPREERDAATLLSNLARSPFACQALARELDIEIDPGESAESYIADAAQTASNELMARDADHEAAYFRRRSAWAGKGGA